MVNEIPIPLHQRLLVLDEVDDRRVVAVRGPVHGAELLRLQQDPPVLEQRPLDRGEQLAPRLAPGRALGLALVVVLAALQQRPPALVALVQLVQRQQPVLHAAQLVLLVQQQPRVQQPEAPVHVERVVALEVDAHLRVAERIVLDCKPCVRQGSLLGEVEERPTTYAGG